MSFKQIRWQMPTFLFGAFVLSFLLTWFHTEPVQAASYSPYDIESNVYKERWDIEGSNEYSSTSGKRLQYDIYKGGGSSNKTGYQIQTADLGKGKEKFLTFTGWAAIVGYTHHNSENQSTYIMAVNTKTKKEKFFRAQMTSLDASKDIEYNRKSSTGPITDRCSNSTYNKVNNDCNMDYKSVGFKAWLPLEDLFPDENKGDEWALYIVKRVGIGSKMNVVHDRLITPFEFEDKKFQVGTITLTSGINAKKLKMLVSDAVRRSAPRSTDNGGNYFTKTKSYNYSTHSEKYTMIWYGVTSPHDGNRTRYAGSLYWRSLGDPAMLKYDVGGKSCPDGSKVPKSDPCTVNVTIKHKDIDTGSVLRVDKKKSTVGEDYSYKPAKTGTFIKNGIPYSADPLGQKYEGTTGNHNLNFTFTYRATENRDVVINGNVKSVYFKQGEDPKASGYFFWELRRTKNDSPSEVYVESKFKRNSTHYAVKSTSLVVLGPDISKQHESAISFTTNANALKNKNLTYNFSYQYTNYYKKIYYWVPPTETHPGYWRYSHTETAWDRGKVFNLENEVEEDLISKVNHSQSESFTVNEMKEIGDNSLVVGKRDNWEDNKRMLHKTYYERFSKPSNSEAKSDTKLHAQTFFIMEPDKVAYEVELPSDEHKKSNFAPLLKQGSSGVYYPADIDISLQKHYALDENYVPGSNAKLVEQTDTKFVTNQTSADYSDAEGYQGKLVPYLYTLGYSPDTIKFVTDQPTVEYDDGEFKGLLAPYVASGTFTAADTKSVTHTISGTLTGTWSWNGSDWDLTINPSSDFLNTFSYNSEGYSGSLSRQTDLAELLKETKPSHVGTVDEKVDISQDVTVDYAGDVIKPEKDTRVYRYEGDVRKPGEEQKEIRYEGYVSKTIGSEVEETPEPSALFALPLQMNRLNQIGFNGNSRTYEINFVTDYFFMSKDFGYIGYYPYAERVKENLVSGKALPGPEEILSDVTDRTSTLFKQQTGETFEDTFLYTASTDSGGLYGTTEKLQRYYVPMDADSWLENKMDYPNEIMLENMGLSDVTFNFAQTFSFDLYLEGSIYDEVAVWEQVEPRIYNANYDFSVTLTPQQQKEIMSIDRNNYALHGFRLVDTKRLSRELKPILPVDFGDWW